jgi:serine/threonine protein phosphatase PrpC
MQIAATGATDVGCVRTNNEDQFVCDVQRGLFIVCDGMGGHAAGEVASAMACTGLQECITHLMQHSSRAHAYKASDAIAQVRHVNDAMDSLSAAIMQAGVNNDRAGMGTTCTAAWFIDPHHVLVAHIGDSRLYLHRDTHTCQITVDHTLVGELVARGLLTSQDAQNHPQAHILARALGAQSGLPAECFVIAVAPGDVLFLCSDGLHAYLPEPRQLAQTLAQAEPARALGQLMAQAKAEGGHDNLTGIVVHVLPETDTLSPLQETMFSTLRSHPAFSTLAPALWRRTAALLEHHHLGEAPTHLPHEGIYWVLSGAIHGQQGAPITAGKWYAPAPLGTLNQYPGPITCEKNTHVAHLTPASLAYLITSHPPLGAHLLGAVMQKPASMAE